MNFVYTFGFACTGAGFLFILLFKKSAKRRIRKRDAVYHLRSLHWEAVVLLIAYQPIIFTVGAITILPLTGRIGGCVYYNIAIYFPEKGENNYGF